MTRIQQWLAGTVVAVVVIVAAGWFVAIAPQKHKAASVNSQAASQEQSNDGLRNRVTALTAQMSAVPAEEASVAAVAAKIPADPELPAYVRALTTAASQTGVELVSISPGIPTTVVIPATATVPTATASASSTAAATPTAAAAPASLEAISLGIDVQGGYFQIQQFTAALQRLARTTVVSTLSLAPQVSIKAAAAAPSASTGATSDAYKSLEATITASVFMNTSTPFTAIPVPSPAAVAATPAAGASPSVTPLLPSAPSASASN
jgi:Tfp pilus assembly protein PilO